MKQDGIERNSTELDLVTCHVTILTLKLDLSLFWISWAHVTCFFWPACWVCSVQAVVALQPVSVGVIFLSDFHSFFLFVCLHVCWLKIKHQSYQKNFFFKYCQNLNYTHFSNLIETLILLLLQLTFIPVELPLWSSWRKISL